MTKPTPGSLAAGLLATGRWDWDAAYCAAYAYLHRAPATRSKWQALADIQRSHPTPITPELERNIEQWYRHIKTGAEPPQEPHP